MTMGNFSLLVVTIPGPHLSMAIPETNGILASITHRHAFLSLQQSQSGGTKRGVKTSSFATRPVEKLRAKAKSGRPQGPPGTSQGQVSWCSHRNGWAKTKKRGPNQAPFSAMATSKNTCFQLLSRWLRARLNFEATPKPNSKTKKVATNPQVFGFPAPPRRQRRRQAAARPARPRGIGALGFRAHRWMLEMKKKPHRWLRDMHPHLNVQTPICPRLPDLKSSKSLKNPLHQSIAPVRFHFLVEAAEHVFLWGDFHQKKTPPGHRRRVAERGTLLMTSMMAGPLGTKSWVWR